MRETMSEMVYCRDDEGLNVLATYFKTDLGTDIEFQYFKVCSIFRSWRVFFDSAPDNKWPSRDFRKVHAVSGCFTTDCQGG